MKKIVFILLLSLITTSLYAEQTFFSRGSLNVKEIALSFDDGPGLNTKDILKILDKKDVKATFFLLGTSVAKRPKLVKDIYSKGHELANHTYNHMNFFRYDEENDKKEKIKEEILQCQDLIKDITGFRTKLVRFPHGYLKEDAIEIARETNYKIINWTFGIDWERALSHEEMLELYLESAKPGTIFLMHDLQKNTTIIKMLPVLIDTLKNKGYKFVTVGEMINKRLSEESL
ncbi:polysaccharide deacetylase family protein [Candidatus Ruminimicrobiellum ovillum]|uniref:polysaccharide deacetylase family protein n=1 Tax=Candidatus Ruminimicrobiellum ovillum TaxID=1947927 RepID=UPI00355A04B6